MIIRKLSERDKKIFVLNADDSTNDNNSVVVAGQDKDERYQNSLQVIKYVHYLVILVKKSSSATMTVMFPAKMTAMNRMESQVRSRSLPMLLHLHRRVVEAATKGRQRQQYHRYRPKRNSSRQRLRGNVEDKNIIPCHQKRTSSATRLREEEEEDARRLSQL